ncbi:hypothetical protein VNO80_05328 [Phaseolus coccineus]|uniref:Uncharacterized protein n=1 Tax=Phaseolus coccineus TaxID=3886 RepID=A0AAN9RGL9_PHACN
MISQSQFTVARCPPTVDTTQSRTTSPFCAFFQSTLLGPTTRRHVSTARVLTTTLWTPRRTTCYIIQLLS